MRKKLPDLLGKFGPKILLVTGRASFDTSSICRELLGLLNSQFELRRVRVEGEPSPWLVDDAVAEHKSFSPDVVLAIGGGSAMDAGKAIAGLLPSGDSVMCYLEGVGRGRMFSGPTVPFIAVPTTAGTGGETSKNAVLSVTGANGFKKSFRHESLVAKHVVLDPELTLSCPPRVSAACGMDALTQLLESYVSRRANPMTDALAISGLQRIRNNLLIVVQNGEDMRARSHMLYASSVSGLTLANAGLGSVHGLASPLGAFFPINHGEACGTLLAEAVAINIQAMQKREATHPSLDKYAEAGRILSGDVHLDKHQALEKLVCLLRSWCEQLAMPRLHAFGVSAANIPKIMTHISGASMSGNPIELEQEEIEQLIRSRL